jgi:hypothetical protein
MRQKFVSKGLHMNVQVIHAQSISCYEVKGISRELLLKNQKAKISVVPEQHRHAKGVQQQLLSVGFLPTPRGSKHGIIFYRGASRSSAGARN